MGQEEFGDAGGREVDGLKERIWKTGLPGQDNFSKTCSKCDSGC